MLLNYFTKPFLRCLLFSLVLIFPSILEAQDSNYNEIPEEFRKHPELGAVKKASHANEVLYELVHLRTENTRTFLNTNKTKSTVHSSVPLHYQDENGFWLSIDYAIQKSGEELFFPSNKPFIEFNSANNILSFKPNESELRFGGDFKLFFTDVDNEIVNSFESPNESETIIVDNNQAKTKNIVPETDYNQSFYNNLFKYSYILNSKTIFPDDFEVLIIEDLIELPLGYELKLENRGTSENRILVLNKFGEVAFIYELPIISDNAENDPKERQNYQPYIGEYDIVPVNATSYKIQIKLQSDWVNSNERVFPLVIDPIVTVVNNDVVNSCFLPNYNQANLEAIIPAGETVFSTDIFYDFVAVQGTNAWMSDQRSYVVSQGGQTPVISGQGNTEGTYQYEILNSQIANGESNGTVEFEFYFARDWGGSGCNNTWNFVNRREVVINYATISFGEGPVLINEYCISNKGNITGQHIGQSFVDNFNRTENWVELYNADPDNFYDLSGHFMSNDIDDPQMWEFQEGIIPPNSKVLVYASRRDISSGTVFHTNFNLRQLRSDDIVFSAPDGELLEHLEIEKTQVNHSRGRITDGAEEWGLFPLPTPGLPNEDAVIGYTSIPIIDLAAGHYTSAVVVSISSENEDEIIRYTLDGSTPTSTSPIYENPITIEETTVLRTRCFSNESGIIPGFIETNTYLISEEHTIPVFSFSGDEDILTLFQGNNTLRPLGHFEYFDKDGSFVDENFGDFNKHGNDSWTYDQRGVDFISRDQFGYNRRLEHKFFETSERTRFRRLMVKAAANDNYPFENGGAHIRDSYIQTLSQLAHLDLDERTSTNVIVYVNGQYWGVYDLRERVDDNNYTDFYYNQDYTYRESDIYLQFLKTWGSTEAHFGNQHALTDWQSLVQYIQGNSMADESNLDYVKSQLNLQSFIDHKVFNSYIVSRDWLNYNTGWWRGTDPNGQAQKWRYILWDTEAALGHFTNYTQMPNVTSSGPPCQVENLNVGNGHVQSLRKLINESDEVRQMYVTRYIDLLNTHLSCENAIAVLDSMVNSIAPEMPRQISRWGGTLSEWEQNVQNVRDFLTERCEYLMGDGLADCYNLTGPFQTEFNVEPAMAGKIKMNSEWLQSYPFNASLFGNIDTDLLAESEPGFAFSHWEVDGAIVTNTEELTLEITQATSIVAHFEDLTIGEGDLIYYWHFNNFNTDEDVTEIPVDIEYIPNSNAKMIYTGSGPRDIDDNSNGSSLNLHLGASPGRCARVRNPSVDRSLVFDVPTTGYETIRFTYAVHRTNNGQLQNHLAYSIDGFNFIQTDLLQTVFDIGLEFDVVAVDFSHIDGVNDNPNFRIRITFEGNNDTSNGNNRFDNITLHGEPIEVDDVSTKNIEKVHFNVYPNPFNDQVSIQGNDVIHNITVIDMVGKQVANKNNIHSFNTTLSLENMIKGVYLLRLETNSGIVTKRIVKN